MPKSLTDAALFSSPVAVPLDAEPRTAGSVETPFQSLANRTYYLQQLAEVTGVSHIKTVADLTALAALDDTGMGVGELRLVPGYGVYRLTAAGAGDDLPWRVESYTASKLWVHAMESLRGASSGFAQTSSGRVVEKPANAIIGVDGLAGEATVTTAAVWPVDLPGGSLTFTGVAAGDKVIITAFLSVAVGGSGNNTKVSIRVSENGGAGVYEPETCKVTGTLSRGVTVTAVHPVTAGGTLVVKASAGRVTTAERVNPNETAAQRIL